MYIVTVEQEQDDDFFGHWILRAAYAVDSPGSKWAVHEALYRWIKNEHEGSTRQCLEVLGIEDKTLRVTVSHVAPLGMLVQVRQERFIPLDCWAGGRHTNSKPVHCALCGWYGAMNQMVHGYTLTSMGEVEPLNRCPQCQAALQ